MDPITSAASTATQGHTPNVGYDLLVKFSLAVQQLKEAYTILLERLSDKAQQKGSANDVEAEGSDRSVQLAVEQFFTQCDEAEAICNSAFRAFQLEKQSELVTQTSGNFGEAVPYSTYLQLVNAHAQFANDVRNCIEHALEALRLQRAESTGIQLQHQRGAGSGYTGTGDNQPVGALGGANQPPPNVGDQQAPLSRLQHLLSNPDFSSGPSSDRSDQPAAARNPYTMDF